MAYKETSPDHDLFKRNTSYENYGGILCCTCSYCVLRTQKPTLKFKNFRTRPPVIKPLTPETGNNPIQTAPVLVEEFTNDIMASGEKVYDLDFDNIKYGSEYWQSPDLIKMQRYANQLIYYPFVNCTGVETQGPYNVPGGTQSQASSAEPNIGPYNSFLIAGTRDYSSNSDIIWRVNACNYPYTPHLWNLYAGPYTGGSFTITTSVYQKVANTLQFYTNFTQTVSSCSESSYPYLRFPDGTVPWGEPEKPPQPMFYGDYTNLVNYVNNHEFSLFGVKPGSGCENNIVYFANVMPYRDYYGYSFDFVYPQYYFYSSSMYNYSGGNASDYIKNGFVLATFNLFLGENTLNDNDTKGLFCYLKCLFKKTFKLEKTICPEWESVLSPIFWNGFTSDYAIYQSEPLTVLVFYGEDFVPETITDQCSWSNYLYVPTYQYEYPIVQDYYLSKVSTINISYNNGNKTVLGANCNFDGANSIQSSGTIYAEKVGAKYTKTAPNGNTTVVFKDVDFKGPYYLETIYETPIQRIIANDPFLAIKTQKLTKYYKARLYTGFRCDVEVNYQSQPLCKVKDIPSKMERIEEFKVKFQNIAPVNYNFSQIDAAAYVLQNNQYMANHPILSSAVNISNVYYSMYNYVYTPPDINQSNEVIINRKGLVKDIVEIEEPVDDYFSCRIIGKNYKDNRGYYGRIYGNEYDNEEYRNCLLVKGDSSIWETKNEIEIKIGSPAEWNALSNYNDIPPVFRPSSSNTNTSKKFYCIFVKQISDNTQNAGQTLIRLAQTEQKAEDNDYLIIDKYASGTNQYGFGLNVKYKRYYRDQSNDFAIGYNNFNINNYNWQSHNGMNSRPSYDFNYSSFKNPSRQFGTGRSQFLTTDFQSITLSPILKCDLDYNNIIVESFHPLRIRFKNSIFKFGPDKKDALSTGSYSFYYNYTYTTPFPYYYPNYFPQPNNGYPLYPFDPYYGSGTAYGTYGFMCDIIFEENIRDEGDGDNIHSFPVEFNQIPQMDLYIQPEVPYESDGKYSDMLMSSYRNPEKCTHIGKVIDRKDCNCPKKWIRQCEIHETTDWKKCMSCPNYQPED